MNMWKDKSSRNWDEVLGWDKGLHRLPEHHKVIHLGSLSKDLISHD